MFHFLPSYRFFWNSHSLKIWGHEAKQLKSFTILKFKAFCPFFDVGDNNFGLSESINLLAKFKLLNIV